MTGQAVAWMCITAPVMDMPGRWVCVPDDAEELTGYGADEDEAIDQMIERHQAATVH